ncbi:deoxyhypusine monooxygenase [Nematocida homosporus]|uniref:deoxyhypusine monooxygenase n=1 Tax=Nematocida homosporus TaxID=1912981 RepID=UPI00221EC664|nr:deoxyhypusine monooxygenase [Nematocida homosporus]KAI5186496.1 deoxyhypusine monooxygenase [Nematocida homosporus]
MTSCSSEIVVRFSNVLQNEQESLKLRFRALFALRNIGCDLSVTEIAKAFTTTSILLKHELAYVLGQMQNPTALPILADVLKNQDENEIVRHEAAEAIATFGDLNYEPLLRHYASIENAQSRAVAETCQIGADLIIKGGAKESLYGSFDPALPLAEESIPRLAEIYLDTSLPLYERYAAMFKLRDIGTEETVEILAQGFDSENRSDLFEHEIAFVFGQMSHPASAKHLARVLADESRHEMVRHECAEALGSIDTPEATKALLLFKDVPNRIIRESVEIGLDIQDYKFSDPTLEYTINNLAPQ